MPKIFVGGISPRFTEIQLAELIAIHGEILTVKIVYDRTTKIAKGYGFVEMRDPAAAQQAIEALNGTTLGKRELRVSLVPDQPKRLTPQESPKAVRAKRTRKVSYQQVEKTKPA